MLALCSRMLQAVVAWAASVRDRSADCENLAFEASLPLPPYLRAVLQRSDSDLKTESETKGSPAEQR
jgi:hypothetical protein